MSWDFCENKLKDISIISKKEKIKFSGAMLNIVKI